MPVQPCCPVHSLALPIQCSKKETINLVHCLLLAVTMLQRRPRIRTRNGNSLCSRASSASSLLPASTATSPARSCSRSRRAQCCKWRARVVLATRSSGRASLFSTRSRLEMPSWQQQSSLLGVAWPPTCGLCKVSTFKGFLKQRTTRTRIATWYLLSLR